MRKASPGLPAFVSPGRRLPVGASALVLTFAIGARAESAGTALQQTSPATSPMTSVQETGLAATPGSITGTILAASGAVITGARVTLASPALASPREGISDMRGQFLFREVPPGSFSLSVALPGFDTVTQTGTLAPGQLVTAPTVVLSLATVSITVDAVTPEQLALKQLHTEEHQRLAGVLPNFFVSYNWAAPPLSTRQKFTLATRNASDPGNLALVGTVAGIQQAANAFPGYHQGAAGYGKRYGADLANLVLGTYLGGAVLPSVFHQDPRYFYRGTGSRRSRFLYAVSRVAVTRGDNGRAQPNFAGVLGDLSAAAISNLYYPASDRAGATLFFENGILALGGDAMNNLFQEFVFNRITSKGKESSKKPVGSP